MRPLGFILNKSGNNWTVLLEEKTMSVIGTFPPSRGAPIEMRPKGKWQLWYYIAGTLATLKWYSMPHATLSCKFSILQFVAPIHRITGYQATRIINIIQRHLMLSLGIRFYPDSTTVQAVRLGTMWEIAEIASSKIKVWIQIHLLKGRTLLAFSEMWLWHFWLMMYS